MSPRVWVLAGDKPGDNAQCLALAAAVGWSTEIKQLHFECRGRNPLLPFSELRFELDPSNSSPLEAPWPDLLIGCGRRSVEIAREIRRRSGGKTRIVYLGRPRTPIDDFDLVVTSAQYQLPDRENVIQLVLPLHAVDREALARAESEWAQALKALPRPRIALLVGGTIKPFVLDDVAARHVADEVNALVRAEGGSVLMTTSRRTPASCARQIRDRLDGPKYVHVWDPAGGPNPYLAYLALADAFVVTGDSASMLADACGTGRRVFFVELPTRRSLRARARNRFRDAVLSPGGRGRGGRGPLARLTAWVMARGWVRYPRDLSRLHDALIASGRAVPLGQSFTAPPPPCVADVESVAARVRALFEQVASP